MKPQEVTRSSRSADTEGHGEDPERALREAIDLRKALYEGSMNFTGFEFVPTPGCDCDICEEVISQGVAAATPYQGDV